MKKTHLKASFLEKTASLNSISRALLLALSLFSMLIIIQPAFALQGGYKVYSHPGSVRMSNTNDRVYVLTGEQAQVKKGKKTDFYYEVKYRHAGTWLKAWVSKKALTSAERKKYPTQKAAQQTLTLNPDFSVRSGPSTKHRKFGKVKNKDYYHTGVTSKNGEWMQLKCRGCKKPRWVHNDAATWTPYEEDKESTDNNTQRPPDFGGGEDLTIGETDDSFENSGGGEVTYSNPERNAEKGKKKDYAAQFMCAARAVGIRKGKKLRRAKYFAATYQKFFHRLKNPPSNKFLRHLYAQQFQETNDLLWLTELRSKYASSRKKHKGRGGIQITHKSNYAHFATFYRKFRNSTGLLTRRQLLSGGKDFKSFEVRNPVNAFNEKHKWGRERNVLAGIFYFLRTSKEKRTFRKAVEVNSWAAARLVGQAVNRGPGAMGARKKAAKHNGTRFKKYKKIGKCFKNR